MLSARGKNSSPSFIRQKNETALPKFITAVSRGKKQASQVQLPQVREKQVTNLQFVTPEYEKTVS
jgi:hypothetical protein